jgi:CRP-like cAMP-binding protein
MGTISTVGTVDKNVLTGDLRYLSLGDIIQLLGANGSTGTLRLASRYAREPAFIYFEHGNPINALNGAKMGLDALYSLFGWTDGEFEFANQDIAGPKVIKKSRMGIILEGLKMKDDGQIEILGPTSADNPKAAIMAANSTIPIVKGPLVDYMYVLDEEDFFDGEFIVEEGRHGNWIWVILEGVVEVLKETKKGPLPVIRIGDGGFIGSLSTFSIHGNMRAASAVAVGNVQLGVIDSQRLGQEHARLPLEIRRLIASLDRRLKQVTARTADYFVSQMAVHPKQRGMKLLVEQGSENDSLVSISQGSASILRTAAQGWTHLADLEEGDFLGAVPFLTLDHEPESASVWVTPDFKADPVDATMFAKEYHGLSTTLRNIIDHVAHCISVSSTVACYYSKIQSETDTK